MLNITGYSDQISVQTGETIRFFVHCEKSCYQAQLVKIRSGDLNPEGPGLKITEIECEINGEYPGIPQTIHTGSYGVVPVSSEQYQRLKPLEKSFGVQLYFFPTTPDRSSQYLLDLFSDAGFYIRLICGNVEVGIGDGHHIETIRTASALASHLWYRLRFTLDSSTCHLLVEPLDRFHAHHRQSITKKTQLTQIQLPHRPLFFCREKAMFKKKGNRHRDFQWQIR